MLIHGKVAEEINGACTQWRTICRCKKKKNEEDIYELVWSEFQDIMVSEKK